MQRTAHNNRGATLIIMTFASVIIFILGLAMMQSGSLTRSLALHDVHDVQAQAAADAGQVDALFRMQKKLHAEAVWDDANLPSAAQVGLPGSKAVYSYAVDYNDPAHPDPATGGFQVTAVGTKGLARKTTHAWLYLGSLFEGITVKESAEIHGSRFAVYPPGSGTFKLTTNSTQPGAIELKNVPEGFPGDLIYPPGGDPDEIFSIFGLPPQGRIYVMTDLPEYPPVPRPAWAVSSPPSLTVKGNMPLAPGDYTYANVTFAGGSSSNGIVVNGKVRIFVENDVEMKSLSQINVEAGGHLELFLAGNLIVHNDAALLNMTDDPTALMIYGLPQCQSIELKNSSSTMGAIYAPSAMVILKNSGDIFGAVVSRSIQMRMSSTFYFDTRLEKLTIDNIAAVFKVGRWWED